MRRSIAAVMALSCIGTTGIMCDRTTETFGTGGHAGASYAELALDGSWCWYSDPRALYHEGKRAQTYVGWVNRAGDIRVAAIDRATQQVTEATLHEKFQTDDHASPTLLARPDGRLMAFYSLHFGDQLCYRISTNPEDISSWEPEVRLATNTDGPAGYTYHNPVQLAGENNRLYLFWRGGTSKPTYATSEDIALDASGYPVIVYTASPDENDHRYRYARWNGHQWLDQEMTLGGPGFPRNPADGSISVAHYAGGIALDHVDPSIVYLSRPQDGVFEIERWMTTDNGRTWKSKPITSGSEKNNVRPLVTVNHPADVPSLFWMYGDYVKWTDYSTALKMY